MKNLSWRVARTRTGSSSAYKTHREDLINIKVAPSTVAGEAGTPRLIQLLRVWCEQKRSHIQFNVLNRQSLLDAQKHPELYRDLVVRIAGYCAYLGGPLADPAGRDHRPTEERI